MTTPASSPLMRQASSFPTARRAGIAHGSFAAHGLANSRRPADRRRAPPAISVSSSARNTTFSSLVFGRGEKVGDAGAKRRQHLLQRRNRRADAIGLDHRDGGVGYAGPPGEFALRQAEPKSPLTQALANIRIVISACSCVKYLERSEQAFNWTNSAAAVTVQKSDHSREIAVKTGDDHVHRRSARRSSQRSRSLLAALHPQSRVQEGAAADLAIEGHALLYAGRSRDYRRHRGAVVLQRRPQSPAYRRGHSAPGRRTGFLADLPVRAPAGVLARRAPDGDGAGRSRSRVFHEFRLRGLRHRAEDRDRLSQRARRRARASV